jgi:Tfp pilus assembly protein PilO
MIGGLRRDRAWIGGGVIVALLLALLAWLLLIRPKGNEATTLRSETDAAQLQQPGLRTRLAAVKQDTAHIDEYRATLAAAQAALPSENAMADFLRALETGEGRTGAAVSSVTVGSPSQVTAAGTKVYALPVTLIAAGRPAAINAFLGQLQGVLPRAVLITSLNALPETGTGAMKMTIGMRAFVVPAATD